MELVEGRATVDSVEAFVARLGEIGEEYGCTLQAFDARYVVGEAHLRRAVELADRALARGENIARERGVEILLYAAGRRQIDQALELGVEAGEGPVVIVVSAEREDGDEAGAAEAVRGALAPDRALGAYDERRVCAYYGITDAERAATDASLTELVCERVALLNVER